MAYLYLVRPHARASRCTYTCATVGRAATSVEDPRTTAELEQFYGAEYPKISEREREKLARGADQGAADGHLQPASGQDAEEASSGSLWARRDRRRLLLRPALLLPECSRIRQRRL